MLMDQYLTCKTHASYCCACVCVCVCVCTKQRESQLVYPSDTSLFLEGPGDSPHPPLSLEGGDSYKPSQDL